MIGGAIAAAIGALVQGTPGSLSLGQLAVGLAILGSLLSGYGLAGIRTTHTEQVWVVLTDDELVEIHCNVLSVPTHVSECHPRIPPKVVEWSRQSHVIEIEGSILHVAASRAVPVLQLLAASPGVVK